MVRREEGGVRVGGRVRVRGFWYCGGKGGSDWVGVEGKGGRGEGGKGERGARGGCFLIYRLDR